MSEDYLNDLKEFENLTKLTIDLSEEIWLKFLSLWFQILEYEPSIHEMLLCYQQCIQLLPILMKKCHFYQIRKDIRISKETSFKSLEKLNENRLKNYFLLTKDEQDKEENKVYYHHIYYLLLISSQTISFVSFESRDEQLFIEKYVELFQIFINRIDKRMQSNLNQSNEIKEQTLAVINERILTFFWNLSDRTILIPFLIQTQLPFKVLQWLSQSSFLTEKSRRPFLGIIQNIARHDDGTDKLNEFNGLEIVKQYQQQKLEKTQTRKLILSMSIALLSTHEQLKDNRKGMNIVLNNLLESIIISFKSDRYRFDGIHISELLEILVKLFVVEERILDYILNHVETNPSSNLISTIQLFIEIFIQFSHSLKESDRVDQLTFIAIANILWSISFLNYTKDYLIENNLFIQILFQLNQEQNQNDIIQQYKPKSMENIQQAIQGILHNLHLIQDNKHLTDIQNKTDENWIMISYCHENLNICNEIYEYLKKSIKNLNIWIDQTHLNNSCDLWESIAYGMEKSNFILCFLSEQYFQSKSCRQEFIYANDSLKKPIIPILISNFQPKGWLGIRMTGLKYIRFKNENQLEEKKKTELLNTILSSLSLKLSHVTNKENLSPSSEHQFEESSSNLNEIQKWFQSNRLSKEFYDLFQFETREEMFDYAQLLFKDREKQMNIYEKIYSQKYHGKQMPPHEFLRFTKSLEQFINDDLNSSTQIKSKTCILL
ncbi:hypothetical protein I4U23_011538 [Adineta vaga]|nr:hypothetical protein I4U23_011538 [Adineta vaga]